MKDREMLGRTILAAFWLGFVFAAGEADARPSGHAAPRSLQRFHQAPAIKGTTQGLHVTRRHHRRPFHHHHLRRGWPFVFAAPYGIGGDFVVPPTAFAESGDVPPGVPVIINRRPCYVQPHIVPAEGTGTMRTVTVTRCY
jgi:hypothetical protein